MEILASILAGGATGLLGTIVSGVSGYIERRQRHQQEVELRQIDLQISQAESESAERIAALEAGSREAEAGWRSLEASYRASQTRWSSGDSGWLVVVDVVRGLIRPVLTIGSLILIAVVYFNIAVIMPDDIGVKIVDTLLYIATTTILWWFGTRPQRRSE